MNFLFLCLALVAYIGIPTAIYGLKTDFESTLKFGMRIAGLVLFLSGFYLSFSPNYADVSAFGIPVAILVQYDVTLAILEQLRGAFALCLLGPVLLFASFFSKVATSVVREQIRREERQKLIPAYREAKTKLEKEQDEAHQKKAEAVATLQHLAKRERNLFERENRFSDEVKEFRKDAKALAEDIDDLNLQKDKYAKIDEKNLRLKSMVTDYKAYKLAWRAMRPHMPNYEDSFGQALQAARQRLKEQKKPADESKSIKEFKTVRSWADYRGPLV